METFCDDGSSPALDVTAELLRRRMSRSVAARDQRPTGDGVIHALEEAVAVLLQRREDRARVELRRDEVLRELLAGAQREGPGADRSDDARELLELADRMDAAQRARDSSSGNHLVRLTAAPLGALSLAGTGLILASLGLGEPAWMSTGIGLVIACGLVPLVIWGGVMARRAHSGVQQRRLGQRALDALHRSGLVLTDDAVPRSRDLRVRGEALARRSLSSSLRDGLVPMLLSDEGRRLVRGQLNSVPRGADDHLIASWIANRNAAPELGVLGLVRIMKGVLSEARSAAWSRGYRLALRSLAGRGGGRLARVADVVAEAADSPRRIRSAGVRSKVCGLQRARRARSVSPDRIRSHDRRRLRTEAPPALLLHERAPG